MLSTPLFFRVVLVFIGAALLLFGVWDLVTPRARFVNSNPPAGTTVSDPPTSITVNFSNKLALESSIEVTSTIKLLPSGEKEYLAGKSVVVKSEIDPGDSSGKSMRADLQLGLYKGLYWVNWRTKATGWGTISYGKSPLAVGMPLPDYIARDERSDFGAQLPVQRSSSRASGRCLAACPRAVSAYEKEISSKEIGRKWA